MFRIHLVSHVCHRARASHWLPRCITPHRLPSRLPFSRLPISRLPFSRLPFRTVPCTSPIVFEVSPIPARTLQPVARDRKLHHLRLDLPDVPQVDVPADPAHVHVQGALRAGHGRGGLPVQYVADGANGGR